MAEEKFKGSYVDGWAKMLHGIDSDLLLSWTLEYASRRLGFIPPVRMTEDLTVTIPKESLGIVLADDKSVILTFRGDSAVIEPKKLVHD